MGGYVLLVCEREMGVDSPLSADGGLDMETVRLEMYVAAVGRFCCSRRLERFLDFRRDETSFCPLAAVP
jgi:hypothetical protein